MVTRAAIKKLSEQVGELEVRMGIGGARLAYVFCPEWLPSDEVIAAHIELHPETTKAGRIVAGQIFGGWDALSNEAFRLVVKRQNEAHGIDAANRMRVKYALAQKVALLPRAGSVRQEHEYNEQTGPRCIAYGIAALCESFGLGESYAREVLGGAGIDLNDPFIEAGMLEGIEQGAKYCGRAEQFAGKPSQFHSHEVALAILAAEARA